MEAEDPAASPEETPAPTPATVPEDDTKAKPGDASQLLPDSDSQEETPPLPLSPEARLYAGVKALWSPRNPYEFLGDNTGQWGFNYTKPINVALDLISALTAERAGLTTPEDTLRHVERVMDGLSQLKTHNGVFPEWVSILEDRVQADVNSDGQVVYSWLDSGWLHLALDLVRQRYEPDRPQFSARVQAMLDAADYFIFVGDEGELRNRVTVDAFTDEPVSRSAGVNDNRNSQYGWSSSTWFPRGRRLPRPGRQWPTPGRRS